jgi:hypothetical protein
MSEVKTLLKHPDPRERALALKLNSISPQDLAIAILDPDPLVWQQVFAHPSASHALDVLSCVNRDAAGNPLHDRHLLLLADPRCTKHHIENMHRATAEDAYLPIDVQAHQLKFLEEALAKTEILEGDYDPTEKHIAHSKEPQLHPELATIYHNATKLGPLKREDEDLYKEGGSSKAIYKINNNKFIVKPYLATALGENQFQGWNEGSSQALYHAAGLGHLHQKSFLGMHDNGEGYKLPVTVIHVEKAKPVHQISEEELKNKPISAEQRKQDAQKIGVMDFLNGEVDRNVKNLMVREDGSLFAIDHGMSFSYFPNNDGTYTPTKKQGTHLPKFTSRATSHFVGSLNHPTNPLGGQDYHKTIKEWWPTVAENVKNEFNKRLELIKDPIQKQELTEGFNARHQWLNNAANSDYDQFLESLHKSLGEADFLHDQHKMNQATSGIGGVHEKLMKAHPPTINAGVKHFESAINNNPYLVEAKKMQGQTAGLQPKAVYEAGNKKYLVKPAKESSTNLGAWNELTSQALYHAGGIGHLHQKVHATVGKTVTGRAEPAHALAVHMEDDAIPLSDAEGWTNGHGKKYEPKDLKRATLTKSNPQHMQSLKQIGLMDYVTSNRDRHGFNIVLKPDGSPIAIDHSRAFEFDRMHAYGNETPNTFKNMANEDENGIRTDPSHQNRWFQGVGHIVSDSHAATTGGAPDQETWKWWDQAKPAMINKFKEHVAMLPGAQVRQKMINSFMARMDNIEKMRSLQSKVLGISSNPAEKTIQTSALPYEKTHQSQVK